MNISGVSTLIEKKTGGVVHHVIRCQQCRICDCAAKRGIQPKKHNCKKNWTGSAKAAGLNKSVCLKDMNAPDYHIVRNMH
jgi:hypothetical protein